MKTIKVKIQGVSPLLQNSFPLQPVEAIEKKSPEEQAEIKCYRDEKTKDLYIPGINLQRALIAAAAYSKGKGRGSLARLAAACFAVSPERISLGTKKYEIDVRSVVVPATKGRVVRYRPRIDNWEMRFELEYDDLLMTVIQVRKIVDDAGSRVGLADFRPEKKGPFGRFIVTEWIT